MPRAVLRMSSGSAGCVPVSHDQKPLDREEESRALALRHRQLRECEVAEIARIEKPQGILHYELGRKHKDCRPEHNLDGILEAALDAPVDEQQRRREFERECVPLLVEI